MVPNVLLHLCQWLTVCPIWLPIWLIRAIMLVLACRILVEEQFEHGSPLGQDLGKAYKR